MRSGSQQEMSADDDDEGPFYCSEEEEEPIEENNSDHIVQDCSDGSEDLKLKDEQSDDLTTVNHSGMALSIEVLYS